MPSDKVPGLDLKHLSKSMSTCYIVDKTLLGFHKFQSLCSFSSFRIVSTGVGSGGGGSFESGGGAKICLCPPPHFQTQNLSLGIGPTDIGDVILAWLASRCWAPSDVPPHTHFVTFLRRWTICQGCQFGLFPAKFHKFGLF